MPGINDDPRQVEEILQAAADAGATGVSGIGAAPARRGARHLHGVAALLPARPRRALRGALCTRRVPAAGRAGAARRARAAGAARRGAAVGAFRREPGRDYERGCRAGDRGARARHRGRRRRSRRSCSDRRRARGRSVTTVTAWSRYRPGRVVLSLYVSVHHDLAHRHMKKLFDTQSHSWREAGLARQLSVRAVKRARIQAIVMVPVLVGILVVYGYRDDLFGPEYETPVQIATTVVLIVLGWQIARDVGPRARARRCSGGSIPGPRARSASSSAWSSSGWPSSSRCASPGSTRARWPSAAPSPRSSSVSRRSRRSATSSPAPCCSARARSASASACACRAAASPGRSRASSARWACSTRPSRRATTT